MSYFTDLVDGNLEKQHQDELEQKRAKRDFYNKAIWDTSGQVSDEVKNYAQEQYFKLLEPGAKKKAQEVHGVIGKIKDAFLGGPKPATAAQPDAASQPASPAPAPQFAQGAADREGVPTVTQSASAEAQPIKQAFLAGPPPAAAAPVSAQVAAPKFFDTPAAVARSLDTEKQVQGFWEQRGKDLGLEGRDLAEYSGSKGTRLPAQTKRIADKGVARPGEDPATGKPYEGLWDHTVDKDGTENWAKRPDVVKGGGAIRSVPHSVSVTDAKATAAQGAAYKNQAGEDIDLDKLPPNMGLQAMVVGDKMFWVPISPTQSEITVGNEKYVVTPYNKDVAHGAGVLQGAARVGTESQGNVPVYNPDTRQFEMLPTHTSSTPVTTGPVAAPAAPVTGGGAPRPLVAPPARAPGTRSMGNLIPSGQYSGVVSRAIPVQEAATQIFGDPAQPSLKGLKDYIDLADDPKSRERLGKALRLTFDGLSAATGNAHISAEAGPVSISTGGIGSILQNYFGVPQKLAEQQSKIMQDAIGSLTPDEREAYDAMMSSFSTVVGLRSLSRASAAASSVAAIERELPVIGVNTFDSRQYADQLQRLAEVVSNGAKQLPKGGLDPKLFQRINSIPEEMQKLKDARKGPAKAPAVKGSTLKVDGTTYNFPDAAAAARARTELQSSGHQVQ